MGGDAHPRTPRAKARQACKGVVTFNVHSSSGNLKSRVINTTQCQINHVRKGIPFSYLYQHLPYFTGDRFVQSFSRRWVGRFPKAPSLARQPTGMLLDHSPGRRHPRGRLFFPAAGAVPLPASLWQRGHLTLFCVPGGARTLPKGDGRRYRSACFPDGGPDPARPAPVSASLRHLTMLCTELHGNCEEVISLYKTDYKP